MSAYIDPWFIALRYCPHGKLCDDDCEECDREEAKEGEEGAAPN